MIQAMEDLHVRHRNRLRHHYTLTSNVLLFGYRSLSDGAKVTYQVVDSYDWTDAHGTRKGYAYPSLKTLGKVRGVNKKTIQRHLAELERVGLLTREKRPGRPNLLVIEDASELETKHYLANYARERVGEDKNALGTLDKNVHTNKKESKQETFKPVNEDKPSRTGENGFERIGSTLKRRTADLRATGERQPPTPKAKRDYLAQQMLSVLGDEQSLGYYRRVASALHEHVIFDALGQVAEAVRGGSTVRNRGALFVSLLARCDATEGRLAILRPGVTDLDKAGV
jgi:DNA-binding transcriptional regulator YhcF (GntR family)